MMSPREIDKFTRDQFKAMKSKKNNEKTMSFKKIDETLKRLDKLLNDINKYKANYK